MTKMHVRTEVTKTYWVGVRSEQKDDLKTGLLRLISNHEQAETVELTDEESEAVSDLRQALLNI
jgi:hypothetical protein